MDSQADDAVGGLSSSLQGAGYEGLLGDPIGGCEAAGPTILVDCRALKGAKSNVNIWCLSIGLSMPYCTYDPTGGCLLSRVVHLFC